MMRRITVLTMVVALVGSNVTFGQETKRERPEQPAPFQSVFVVPGITLSDAQRIKLDALRETHAPTLRELQRSLNSVLTQDQRKNRQHTIRTAREEGKSRQEVRSLAESAIQLTDVQKKELDELRRDQVQLLARIRRDVDAVLTDQQRSQQRRTQKNRTGQSRNGQSRTGQNRSGSTPTHKNLKYGRYERNVMDVWLANSKQPTPVLVSIHGGGFRGGNKGVSGGILKQCLDAGISVVAITYRLSDEAIAPAPFLDSARAIQFIRHNSKTWNIDPTRIAATGGSAGAGISLWLGFHNDLADPKNSDPVLRESTRLTCMAVYNGQTSYDPRFIRELFPGHDTFKHSALAQLYDVDLNDLDNLPKHKLKLFEEVSALPHLTKDDVPAALFYASKMETPITSQGIGIHHPRFGKVLEERMTKLGLECVVHTGTPRNADWTQLTVAFVKKHFGIK